jgi:hypothetical protein
MDDCMLMWSLWPPHPWCRGRRFTGGRGCCMPRHWIPRCRRGTPATPLNQGQRPDPSTPVVVASSHTTNASSECTRMVTPPYTNGIVLNGQRNSTAPHLPTPTPPEDPPRRPLVFRLRLPGYTELGIGIIPNLTSPTTAMVGTTGFGPQVAPSTVAPPAITASAASAVPASPSGLAALLARRL